MVTNNYEELTFAQAHVEGVPLVLKSADYTNVPLLVGY